MNRASLIRIAVAFVATTATWIIALTHADALALPLAALVTLAIAASLLDWFFSPAETVANAATSPASGNLGPAENVLASLSDAAFAYDPAFKVTFANKAALDLFGIPHERFASLVITPQLAQQDARLARLIQVVYPSLAPLAVPQGTDVPGLQVVDLTLPEPETHYRVSTLALPDGRGFLKVVQDRTRQIALIRGKGEFVTVASHQLRTPLTEISWALETLAGSATMNPDDKAIATQTLDSVHGLIRTAEDLLGVAKIEEGRFGYAFAPLDVTAFLEEELSKAMPLAASAGLALSFDRPTAALPPVFADRAKLAMVLNNLVENAIRYNVPGGEIVVKAEQAADEPYVKVSVRDTGIGIAAADIAKLFTKFFRADNARKAVAGGTGLGLYIASNIVRAHGGQMSVGSELGRGTTFSFTLATDRSLLPQHESAEEF